MLRQISFLLILLVAGVPAFSQDGLDELKKISGAYEKANGIQFSGNIKMYVKNNPAKVVERMQCHYTMKGKNFLCRLGPIQMMMNDRYYVSVDHSDKLVMVGRAKDIASTQMPVFSIDQLRKFITEKKISVSAKTIGASGFLEVTDPRGSSGFVNQKIEYDLKTGYLKKVLLESINDEDSDGNTILEIVYSEPVPVTATSNLFSEKEFFSIVDKSVQLTPAYKGFQILNQL